MLNSSLGGTTMFGRPKAKKVVRVVLVVSVLLFGLVAGQSGGNARGDSRLLPGPTSHEDDADNSGLVLPRAIRHGHPASPPPFFAGIKGDFADLPVELLTAESRKKNRRQNYSHRSPPRNSHYSTQNRHSNGGKNGKGGYHNSNSYQGNRGYSTSQDYSRANRDSYADQANKKYGSQHGDSHGDSSSGGYGGSRGLYSREYGDDGGSYTRADEY